MRFATSGVPAEIPGVMARMTSMLSWKSWKEDLRKIKKEADNDPIWREYLLGKHGLEISYGEIRQHFNNTGRYIWPPTTLDQLRFYSFLIMVVRVHNRLSKSGQKRMADALRKHLNGDFGLAPLAFEMTVASHLMSRGFDVHFHDLEEGGGYDFLIASDSSKAEVECKYVSTDLGRQIHRRAMYRFGKLLVPSLLEETERSSCVRVVEVILPGRLKRNHDEQKNLSEIIFSFLHCKAEEKTSSLCSMKSFTLPIEGTPFEQRTPACKDTIQHYLKSKLNIDATYMIPYWRPGKSAVVVALRSKKPDQVVKAMHKKLKQDSKAQFSGSRPAILCVGLDEVSADDMNQLHSVQEVGDRPPIQIMTSDLLNRRPHLHTVAFWSEGQFLEGASETADMRKTVWVHSGRTFAFSNPLHSSSDDPALANVFA